MTLLLGIDTGGTYTDAVLMEDGADGRVIASAKALTTHDDLSLGIVQAIEAVLEQRGAPPDIGLVSVSTTLATNALVEGRGNPVALVFAGFDPADAGRAGLMQALDGDPLMLIGGGHDSAGKELLPPDLVGLGHQIDALSPLPHAFAVVSRFASRNPVHEVTIRAFLRDRTGLPITCGHELSAKLNGPLRAVTTVLNARLIGLISSLIEAVETTMSRLNITAPLMLVRGDGALVSATMAKTRPIETILSGPAASLVGAAALTGVRDAVIADIGGTTTDIAILRDGKPALSPEGASVGSHRTMVEAVDMRAIGLGGDSALHIDDSGLNARLSLGPRRVIPVSLLALDHGPAPLEALQHDLDAGRPGADAAQFAVVTPGADASTLGALDRDLLDKIGSAPAPLVQFTANPRHRAALRRLVRAGVLRLAGVTPSDAAHVLGLHDAWDGNAARLALDLLALRRDGRGQRIAASGAELAQAVLDQLTYQSADAVLSAALSHDGIDLKAPLADPLIATADRAEARATRLDIGVALPLVGLGASAPVYYPAIAKRLGTTAILPELVAVANAVGAVSGRISIQIRLSVTETTEGTFQILPSRRNDLYPDAERAIEAACRQAADQACAQALDAGADAPATNTQISRKTATIEGRATLVEAVVTATATGRPRLGRAALDN